MHEQDAGAACHEIHVTDLGILVLIRNTKELVVSGHLALGKETEGILGIQSLHFELVLAINPFFRQYSEDLFSQ